MSNTDGLKITISPLRLHAASSVWIPNYSHRFRSILPRPLKLFSASSVNLHGASNSNIFRNNLRVGLFLFKSPVLRK